MKTNKTKKFSVLSLEKRKRKSMYHMVLLKKQKCFSVQGKYKTKKRIFSKCTTEDNAKKQIRLLNAIRYNPNFKRTKRIRPKN